MPFQSPPQLKASLFSATPGGKPKGGAKPAPKASGPKGVAIEHRIGVQAPAEVVWEILYDLEGWSDWNPTYPRASGTIRIGAPLSLTLALPEQPPEEIQPTVLEWVPHEQLHWSLRAMGGLVRTTRYIEIETLAEASCLIANGEIIGGLLGRRYARARGRAMHRAFQAMNEALKARAEAAFAGR